jgi:hypothetical protein
MEKQLKDLVEVQNRLECMAQGLWSCEEDESCGQGDFSLVARGVHWMEIPSMKPQHADVIWLCWM